MTRERVNRAARLTRRVLGDRELEFDEENAEKYEDRPADLQDEDELTDVKR